MGQTEKHPAFAGLNDKKIRRELGTLPTPCYVIDEEKLKKNGEILASLRKRSRCKILLAQKAFSNFDFYPLLSAYLTGTEASGLFEARLGAEEMPGKEVHVFCGAYREEEFEELLRYADHLVFNSVRQLQMFGSRAKASGKSVGLRINPECSTQEGHAIYDPCAPGSRLGVTRSEWDRTMTEELLQLLDGLHFHTLCEQDADALETTLTAVEKKFGDILPKMKWLNMGGGHHITKPGYDVKKLEDIICRTREKWQLEVYLEPGEAVALNAGYLVTRVLDVVHNENTKIAVLDCSAACHMPDVIEMPYVPPLYGAVRAEHGDNEEIIKEDGAGKEKRRYCYRLAGPTCLAGDVIGEYYFPEELQEGDLLVFGDMAIYTTCKNNTFNGMPLPDIWKRTEGGELIRLTGFGYEEFKRRLGRI